MAVVLFMLLAAGVFTAAFFADREKQRKLDAAWAEAAEVLGLQVRCFEGKRSITGKLGPLQVRFETEIRGSGKNRRLYTRGVVEGRWTVRGISAASEGAFAKLEKLLGAQDVRLGDPAFDRRVHLQGHEARVLAVMGHETRSALLRAVELGARLEQDGTVCIEREGASAKSAEIVETVRSMAEAARLLAVHPGDFVEQLAENAVRDPHPIVRRRNFEILVADFRSSEETRKTAEQLLEDREPELRVAAARFLGGGRPAFDALRAVAEGTGQPDPRRAALAAMLDLYPYEVAGPTLDVVLRTGRPALRMQALDAIADARDLSRLETVLRMETHGDGLLAASVARTLGMLADPRGEPTLVAMLAHESEEARAAAARALGVFGTIAAVEPLLPLTEGFSTPRAVKEAAREAIRKIQARLGPAEGGRISLAADDEQRGNLSLASEAGEISLVPETDSVPSRGRERA